MFRDQGGVIVPSALGSAVADIMFGTGGDGMGIGEAISLKALRHSRRHCGSQERIFPRRFGNPAPAGIAGDVEHRGEGPVNAHLGSLLRRDGSGFLHQVGIPTGGLAQGNREHRAVAVDHIAAEDQRDPQAAFLHRHPLQFFLVRAVAGIQEGADPAPTDHRTELLNIIVARPEMELGQLTDFFLKRHLNQQRIDLCVFGGFRS